MGKPVLAGMKSLFKALACSIRGLRDFSEDSYVSLLAELRYPGRVSLGKGAVLEHHARLCANGTGASISIGDYTTIYPYALLKTNGGAIRIGEDSSVNDYAVLHAKGRIEIGRDVHIAPHAMLIAAEHDYSLLGRSDFSSRMEGKGIMIHDSVWIGAGAVVLDGCTIGEGTVIGAGAVVTADIEPYSVAVGVPARVIKKRERK